MSLVAQNVITGFYYTRYSITSWEMFV